MKKASSKYVCTECGGVSPAWLGKCPVCGKFGTLVEEIETPQITGKQAPVIASKPKPLKDIEKEKIEGIIISSVIPALNYTKKYHACRN